MDSRIPKSARTLFHCRQLRNGKVKNCEEWKSSLVPLCKFVRRTFVKCKSERLSDVDYRTCLPVFVIVAAVASLAAAQNNEK
jgi:hypothetical protein